MISVLSNEEMRKADEYTIETMGLKGEILMENAGKACAEVLLDELSDYPFPPAIIVLSGKGNNGGDGYVVARYLQAAGYETEVWTLAAPDSLKGDAAFHYGIARKYGVPVTQIERPEDIPLNDFDVVVDALLGTGSRGAPHGKIAEIIELVNMSGLYVVSIDIASGLSGNTGKVEGNPIRAELTLAIHNPKIAHVIEPARSLCGKVEVVDIGLSPEGMKECRSFLFTEEDAWFPPFAPDTHKFRRGEVMIIGGSVRMAGALRWAASGSQHSGAGYVTLAVPGSAHDIVKALVPEAVSLILPERNGVLNVDAALELISGSLGKTRAVLLGNGMGISPENRDFVNRLLPAIPDAIPVVLDADALKMVDLNKPEIRSKKLIFTPHRGELESLLGEKFDLSLPESELWPMLSEWLPDNWILDLKGSPSVTVSKDQTIINSSGGPELAIAGSGDLMAGYLAGLLAFRTERSSYLTALANFVHGRSGDFAAEKFGRYGVTIEAVSALLPEVISDLSEDEI